MKTSNLRAGIALACALGLSACGGGNNGQLYLGGSVYNVTKDGLVLQNNGGSDLAIPGGAMGFDFPDLIGIDATYNVTVKSIPSNAEKCTVANGSGRAVYSVNNIVVSCELKTHKLSGKININGQGNAVGLVILNGSDRVTITSADMTTFQMTPVGEDIHYGITVLSAPPGMVCTVSPNGVGTMRTNDIEVEINCGRP